MENDFSVCRVNFRGVGKSDGEFDNGQGELADAAAALDWLERENFVFTSCSAHDVSRNLHTELPVDVVDSTTGGPPSCQPGLVIRITTPAARCPPNHTGAETVRGSCCQTRVVTSSLPCKLARAIKHLVEHVVHLILRETGLVRIFSRVLVVRRPPPTPLLACTGTSHFLVSCVKVEVFIFFWYHNVFC